MHLTLLMRPKSLDEIIGQEHLIGENKPLTLMLQKGKLSLMLFYGNCGVGKTSLTMILKKLPNIDLVILSATSSGINEIKEIIKNSQNYLLQKVIFLDEIHRFNKNQQDIFLPYIENENIVLITATTENPSFAINNALLSRMHTFQFKPLNFQNLNTIIDKSLKFLKSKTLDVESRNLLIHFADSDAQKLLNILDLLKNIEKIDQKIIPNNLPANINKFDNKGDIFYEKISALHKSIRGSNIDGALYWFCATIKGGIDRNYLVRRLLKIAFEDIGLADPKAIDIIINAVKTYQILGTPEGELALAQATIYLCTARLKAMQDISLLIKPWSLYKKKKQEKFLTT